MPIAGVTGEAEVLRGSRAIVGPLRALLTWLAEADTETLAAWCALAAEFQKDTRSMTAARIGQMRTLAAELGMTPSARTRLGAIPRAPTKKKSPYFA